MQKCYTDTCTLKPLYMISSYQGYIMLQFDIIQRGDGGGERAGAREAHYIMMCKR